MDVGNSVWADNACHCSLSKVTLSPVPERSGSAWLWARIPLQHPSVCPVLDLRPLVLRQRCGLTRPSVSRNAGKIPAEDRVSLTLKLQTTAFPQGCFWLCGKTISFRASLAGLRARPPRLRGTTWSQLIQRPACSWQPITITISSDLLAPLWRICYPSLCTC